MEWSGEERRERKDEESWGVRQGQSSKSERERGRDTEIGKDREEEEEGKEGERKEKTGNRARTWRKRSDYIGFT